MYVYTYVSAVAFTYSGAVIYVVILIRNFRIQQQNVPEVSISKSSNFLKSLWGVLNFHFGNNEHKSTRGQVCRE